MSDFCRAEQVWYSLPRYLFALLCVFVLLVVAFFLLPPHQEAVSCLCGLELGALSEALAFQTGSSLIPLLPLDHCWEMQMWETIIVDTLVLNTLFDLRYEYPYIQTKDIIILFPELTRAQTSIQLTCVQCYVIWFAC